MREARRVARRLLRILPYKGNRVYQYYLNRLKVNGQRKSQASFFYQRSEERLYTTRRNG